MSEQMQQEIPSSYEYGNLVPAIGAITPKQEGYRVSDSEVMAAHGVSEIDAVSSGVMGIAGIYMGAEFMSQPGTANKLLGAGLIMKGVKDQYEAMTPAPRDGSFRDKIRSRIRDFSMSLIENNDKPGTLRQKMKRGVGEELLSMQDIGYRNRINRMVGSLFLLGAGLEMYDTDTTAGKTAGLVAAGMAFYETTRAASDVNDVRNDAVTRQTDIVQAGREG